MPHITGVSAALIGLLAVYLTANVIRFRLRFKVGAGDGGHPELAQAIRAHGNLIEHAPLALILIGSAEALGANSGLIYVLGALLVIGRLASAWGLSRSSGTSQGRQIGLVLTAIAMLVASLTVLTKIASGF
jgi:uncharacterized membrane protein YecN with MAPEG domain